MVIVKRGGREFAIDGYVKKVLDRCKSIVKFDWDMVFIIDGIEGCGKSCMAQLLGYYVDPTLNNSRIVFTAEKFKQAILNAEKYQAVIFDESYQGLSSRGAMSFVNKNLISMMAEIRQKNLFIFVVMPCVFDLDRYISLHRSRGLWHCYTNKFQRGYVKFYNIDLKKKLIMNGKKYYSYAFPKPNFKARFSKFYADNEIEYKKNKSGSLEDREDSEELQLNKRKNQVELFKRLQGLEDIDLKHDLKMKILDLKRSTYYIWLRKFNLNEEF